MLTVSSDFELLFSLSNWKMLKNMRLSLEGVYMVFLVYPQTNEAQNAIDASSCKGFKVCVPDW